jgi:hypothetical protein
MAQLPLMLSLAVLLFVICVSVPSPLMLKTEMVGGRSAIGGTYLSPPICPEFNAKRKFPGLSIARF